MRASSSEPSNPSTRPACIADAVRRTGETTGSSRQVLLQRSVHPPEWLCLWHRAAPRGIDSEEGGRPTSACIHPRTGGVLDAAMPGQLSPRRGTESEWDQPPQHTVCLTHAVFTPGRPNNLAPALRSALHQALMTSSRRSSVHGTCSNSSLHALRMKQTTCLCTAIHEGLAPVQSGASHGRRILVMCKLGPSGCLQCTARTPPLKASCRQSPRRCA